MSGKVAGGRETMAAWIASPITGTTSASAASSPANCMNDRTCSSGESSRCSAHKPSSRSVWRSYASSSAERAGRSPWSRNMASSRAIRNARIAPASDCAGMTAIVPHQSNVTPWIVMDGLDVEDDLGDPFLRIHGEPVARHGLDHELQLVPPLVDRFPARAAFERCLDDPRVERREEKSLRLVDVQEFRQPSKEEGRKVLRLKADLDLADGLHGPQVRDEAEHPLGGICEQFVRGPPVRADADIGRVLDFLVAHAEERGGSWAEHCRGPGKIHDRCQAKSGCAAGPAGGAAGGPPSTTPPHESTPNPSAPLV